MTVKQCKVPDCYRRAHSLGMCAAHYGRNRRYGSPEGRYVMRDIKPETCSVEGCDRPYSCRGLCRTHYEKMRSTGTLKLKIRSRGQGTISKGYVEFSRRVNGKEVVVRRSRLVMAKKLGRELRPNETVHHKNGNKLDDRPENLELWTSTHPPGQRVSDLVAYAKEILKLYGREGHGSE